MNITSPILTGAANAAELPSDSVSTLLRAFGTGSPDGGTVTSEIHDAFAIRYRVL